MDEWHYSIGLVDVCPNSDLQGQKQFSAPLRVLRGQKSSSPCSSVEKGVLSVSSWPFLDKKQSSADKKDVLRAPSRDFAD